MILKPCCTIKTKLELHVEKQKAKHLNLYGIYLVEREDCETTITVKPLPKQNLFQLLHVHVYIPSAIRSLLCINKSMLSTDKAGKKK